jgi:hypothetical protein
MSKRIKYTKGPVGAVRIVEDFLPPPSQLVVKEDVEKVTISLSKRRGGAMSVSKSSQAAFEAITRLAPPSLRPICSALRLQILRIDPTATMLVWPRLKIASFGIGPKKYTHHYAYVAVYAKHINLGFYHGAMLSSVGVSLDGSGKNLRHLKLRTEKDAAAPYISKLLRAAVEERRRNAPAS